MDSNRSNSHVFVKEDGLFEIDTILCNRMCVAGRATFAASLARVEDVQALLSSASPPLVDEELDCMRKKQALENELKFDGLVQKAFMAMTSPRDLRVPSSLLDDNVRYILKESWVHRGNHEQTMYKDVHCSSAKGAFGVARLVWGSNTDTAMDIMEVPGAKPWDPAGREDRAGRQGRKLRSL